MERRHMPAANLITAELFKVAATDFRKAATEPEGPESPEFIGAVCGLRVHAEFKSALIFSPPHDDLEPTRYRLTALAIAKRTDADTDPETAAALALIASAWVELAEEQDWLNADWWC
jgi:hypothetical protein